MSAAAERFRVKPENDLRRHRKRVHAAARRGLSHEEIAARVKIPAPHVALILTAWPVDGGKGKPRGLDDAGS